MAEILESASAKQLPCRPSQPCMLTHPSEGQTRPPRAALPQWCVPSPNKLPFPAYLQLLHLQPQHVCLHAQTLPSSSARKAGPPLPSLRRRATLARQRSRRALPRRAPGSQLPGAGRCPGGAGHAAASVAAVVAWRPALQQLLQLAQL